MHPNTLFLLLRDTKQASRRRARGAPSQNRRLPSSTWADISSVIWRRKRSIRLTSILRVGALKTIG